jgi:putative endonuclease
MWYTYIIECADGTLYCGITNNIDKRMKGHMLGKAAKYTASHGFRALVYVEKYPNRSMASKREYAIKQLSRVEKLELVDKSSRS